MMDPELLRAAAKERGVEPRLVEGLVRYFAFGIEPGGLLSACLCNEFALAVIRADDVRVLRPIAMLLYNDVPSDAWGSRENMERWMIKSIFEINFPDEILVDRIRKKKGTK